MAWLSEKEVQINWGAYEERCSQSSRGVNYIEETDKNDHSTHTELNKKKLDLKQWKTGMSQIAQLKKKKTRCEASTLMASWDLDHTEGKSKRRKALLQGQRPNQKGGGHD